MDKSRMTFTFRPSRKDSGGAARELRDRRPFEFQPRSERKSYFRNPDEYEKRDVTPPFFRWSWLLPAVLAAVTGITLGLGVLFLFKNATPESRPTVTTLNPHQGGTAANPSTQSFPGLDLVAYQVGVYKDHDSAKKGAAEFEKFGIRPVLRNSDKVQLFVGIASDKSQGQAVAEALNQVKAPFYVREYKVEQRKGAIQGISNKDAATLSSVLTQMAQIMKDGIPLAIEKSPKKETVEGWSKRVQSLGGQAEIVRKILEKAGRKGELARLDDMLQQLQEAGTLMTQGKGTLDVQRHLVQSIVDYEELTAKLIPQ